MSAPLCAKARLKLILFFVQTAVLLSILLCSLPRSSLFLVGARARYFSGLWHGKEKYRKKNAWKKPLKGEEGGGPFPKSFVCHIFRERGNKGSIQDSSKELNKSIFGQLLAPQPE